MNNGASVHHEGDTTWIKGVPILEWGKGKECTFAGALEAALRPTAYPCNYANIMGVTGLAFRTRWFCGNDKQRWCPSCAIGEMPEEINAAATATGWPLRTHMVDGDDYLTEQRLNEAIVCSIDAGLPVLAHESNLNVAVIYGYERNGKTLLLRDYTAGNEPLRLAPAQLGFLLLFLGEHIEPPSPEECAQQALHIGARNWQRERLATGPGEYWYGDTAFQHWEADLAEKNMGEESKRMLHSVSWWNINALFDARKAAVTFLFSAAEHLSDPAADCAVRVAELYHEEIQLLAGVFEAKRAFVRDYVDWTSQIRQKEYEVLCTAHLIETAAAMQMERVVRRESVTTRW